MPGQKVFIQVRIYEDEDSLVLSVQDISRGIDQETLEKLQQQLGTAAHPDRRDSGYGLYNVNERIHILFGSSYGYPGRLTGRDWASAFPALLPTDRMPGIR